MAKDNKKDVYDELMEYYISLGQGAPNMKESKELLKARFTEKDARIAMMLPFWKEKGVTSKALAAKENLGADKLEAALDRMAREGILFARENSETGEAEYTLWEYGRLTAFYQPGRTDKAFKKATAIWEKFYKNGSGRPSKYPLNRVLPYAKGIAEGEEITPTETVEFTLENLRAIAVAGCPCRVGLKKCDAEIMTCFQFDDMADYFVKYHGGRYMTPEESKAFIEKHVEGGLITTAINYETITYGFCLCCADCCIPIIRPYVDKHDYYAVEKSNFRPKFDHDKCTRCGKCRKACPLDAIDREPAPYGKKKKEDTMFLHENQCIGCGVCVAQCKYDALKLYRVDNKVPEADRLDALKRNAAEKIL